MANNSGILLITIVIGGLYFLAFHVLQKWSSGDTSMIFDYQRDLKNATKKEKHHFEEIPDTTFIGRSNKQKILIPNQSKHIYVCGTTGSGKTVALSNFVKTAIEANYPLLVIDGKGDIGADSLLDIVGKLHQGKKVYCINLNDPENSDKYNPFKNTSPTIIKDMLVNLSNWSEEHYKANTERYLQKLIHLLQIADIELSFPNIVKHIPAEKLEQLSARLVKDKILTKEQHIANLELCKAAGDIAEAAAARFSIIIEGDLGNIFTDDGIDIYTAIKENAVILFILNPLIYPELSPLFGKLAIIDSKKAVSKLYTEPIERCFFIFDEINVYASKSLLDLVNKSRSAHITCILASQSLSDLEEAEGEYFKEQVIENCNNYIVMRQNSAKNAEQWASIFGTRQTMDVTYQLKSDNNISSDTGLGSARRVREYIYHPDEIKNLATGEAFFVSKDYRIRKKIKVNKPF